VRSFIERLLFPYLTYTDPPQSLFARKIKTGFIYTMNSTEDQMKERGYLQHFALHGNYLKMIFGYSEYLCSFDTYQFEDYSKVVSDRFDPEKKAKGRKEVFPKDCHKAYEMGARFARGGK
jgi:multimeric flavodoxin WrbA